MPSLNRRRRAITLLLAALGWLVLASNAVGDEVIRSFAVFVFVLIGSGTALVRLFPLRDSLERAVLAVALRMSSAAAVTELPRAVKAPC